MKKRHFLKITAVLTAFFIASDPGCSYASAARVDSAASLNIPSDLGREEESFRGLSPKTILYIQDAHDSFEAQKNIASLVTHLTEKSGVKTVFEEGYEGPVPTDTFFGFIPDGETRLKVSAFLLDKLRIGGAEYAHINRKADFNLIGADHLEHYRQNIQAFRDAAEKNADIENDLTAILTEIESLVHQKFPKPLREWLDTRDRYEAGQLDLLAYAERGWKILESQPEGVASKKALPLISILLAARITPDETLAAKARAIEPQELFREITALDKAIAALFTREEKETLLLHYRSALHLLKRLNQIEVSPAEYAASKEILSGLNTRELADFIAQESRKSLVLSKAWEENIKTASRFYELAHQRDNAIEQTLRNYLSGTAENTAVLVYGGFHKAGILSILRKLGVSYRVITPNISGTDPVHENYYKKLMAEGVHDYEKSIFPSKGIASTATRPPSLFVETFGEASVQALYKAASQKPGTPMELLGQAVQESRSELRMVSSFDMELAFGELARTPDLSGGRNNDFLYEDGKKVAVILPWSKFIYRALDKDGREIPDRVYKITHYTAENEVLFEEAKKIFGLQTPGVSKLQRIGRLKDGGLWIELKGIPSARSLDREIFGRVERLFSTLIRAGELLEGIHERGVVHGDIKPGNLLINNDQELEWIDFGGNFTRGYAALNDEKQPLADSVSPDVDVYSFIMMMAHLLDHQIQSQPPAIAATLLRMRNEYLHLILKNWSFKNFEELLQVGVWTERLTPLPRKQRPQNMSAVIDKLKRDLSEIQTLLASEAGPEARSELRASSEGYNLIQHLFFEASITPETIAAAEALIPVPILDRLIREGYEFPEGFKTQAAPGAGRKLILDIQKGGGFLTVILKDALNPGHEFLKIPLSVEKKRLKLGFGHLNQFDEAKAAYPDYSDPVFAWWIARNLLPFARQSGFTILDLIQGPLSDADLKKSGFKRRNDGSGIPLWIYPLGQPLPNEVSRKQDLQKWVRQAPVLFSRPGVGSVIALPPENAAAFVPDAGQNWTMIQTFAEELAAVHRSAFRGNQPEENNPEQWVKHLTSPSMRILIQVNEEGTIEGYLLSEDWNSSPESVFLKSVAVIDEVQLQKKGGLLLDTFLMTVYNTSKSRKITWLSNFAVIALYKRYLERRNIPYEFDDWTKFTVPVSGLAAFSNALASGRSELRSVEEDAAEALGGSRRIILSAGEKILVSGFNPHKNTSALIEVRTVEKSPAREIGARVKSPRREAEIRVSAPADILILRDNEWLEFLEQHENPPADVNRLGQWNLLSLGSLRDSLLARSFGRRFMSWRAYLPAERKIHLFDLVTKARLEVEIIYADPLQNQAELSLRPAVTAAPDLFFSVQPISAVSQTQPQSTRSELRASYSEEPAASGLNLTGTLLLPDLFVASPAFTKLLTFKEFFFSTAPQGTRRGLIDDLINGRKAFSPRIQDHFRGPSPARRAFFIAGSPANPASEYSEYEIYKTLAGLLLNMLEEPEKQIFSDFYKQHFSSDRQFVKVIRGMGDFRGIVVSESYVNSSSVPAIIQHEQFHMTLDEFLKAASKNPALRKDFEDVRKLLPVFVSAGGLESLQASLGKLGAYSDPIEALKKGNFSFTEEFLAQTLYMTDAPAGLESAFAALKSTLARIEAENPDFQAGMRVLRRLQPSSDAKAAEKNELLSRYLNQKQPEKQTAPAPEPRADEGLASFSSESLRDLYVKAPQNFISNLTLRLQQHFTRAGLAGGALSVGNLIIIQVIEGASIRSASLDITGAVDFEQLSQKTREFLTLRSELRAETPAELLGFDRSTPLWDFLSAFGIDPAQAKVETLESPWGRVTAAQHEAFGVDAGNDLREAVLESAYAVFDSREIRERLKEQSIPEDKAVDFLYLLTFEKIPVSLVWAIPGEPFQPLFYYPLAGPGLEPLWKESAPDARTSISSPPLPQDLEFFIRAHHKKDFGKNPLLQGGLPLSMQRYGLPGGTLREFEEGLAFPTVFSLNHQTSKGLVETAGQLIAAGIFSIEGETVSEVGTGAGWVAAQMALRGASDVHAYDLNLMKAANASQTARRHGVTGRFHAYRARSANVLPSSRLYLWNIPDFADSASGVLDQKILDQSASIAVNNRIPAESVRTVFQELSVKARPDSLFLVRIHPWDEPAFFEMLKGSGWESHPASEREIQNPGRGGSFFLLRPELEKEAAARRAKEDALTRNFRGTPETLEALRAVAKDLQPDQHGSPVLLIEGLPGSGKSSRAEDLKAVLESQGRKAVVIHSEHYLLQGRYNKPIRAFFGLLTRWIARQPNENLFDYAARAFVDTSRVERWIRDINALRAEGGLLTIDRDQKIQEKLTPDTVLIIEGTLSSHLFRKLSGAKRLFLDVPAKTIRHQFVKRTLFEAAGGAVYGSFKARLMAPGIAVGFFRRHAARFDFILKTQASGTVSLIRPRIAGTMRGPAETPGVPSRSELRNTHPLDLTPEEKNLILKSSGSGFHRQGAVDETTPIWFFGEQEVVEPFIAPFFSQASDKALPSEFFQNKKVLVMPGYGNLPFVLRAFGAREVVAADRDPVTIAWQKLKWKSGVENINDWLFVSESSRFLIQSAVRQQWLHSLNKPVDPSSTFDGMTFQTADILQPLPVTGEKYDLIVVPYLFGFAHGLVTDDQWDKALENLGKVLAPGGRVILAPGKLDLSKLKESDEKIQTENYQIWLNDLERKGWDVSHSKRYSFHHILGFEPVSAGFSILTPRSELRSDEASPQSPEAENSSEDSFSRSEAEYSRLVQAIEKLPNFIPAFAEIHEFKSHLENEDPQLNTMLRKAMYFYLTAISEHNGGAYRNKSPRSLYENDKRSWYDLLNNAMQTVSVGLLLIEQLISTAPEKVSSQTFLESFMKNSQTMLAMGYMKSQFETKRRAGEIEQLFEEQRPKSGTALDPLDKEVPTTFGGPYTLRRIVQHLEVKQGAWFFGPLLYEELGDADRKTVAAALTAETRERLSFFQFIDSAWDEIKPASGQDAGVENLRKRTHFKTLRAALSDIFSFGIRYDAYGVEGFHDLLQIAFEGKVRSLFRGSLTAHPQFASDSAGEHGSFYVIFKHNIQDPFDDQRDHHRWYLVPEQSDKDAISAMAEKAVGKGLLAPEVSADIQGKLVTYQEFINLNRSELRNLKDSKGSQETAAVKKAVPIPADELKVMRASLRHYLRRQIEDRTIDPKKYEFVSDILPYRILAAKDARGKILGFAFGKKGNRHMHYIVTAKDHEPDGFIYEKDDHGIRIITYVTEGDKNYKEDVFVLGRFGDVYRLKIEESGGHPSQQSLEYHNWMPSYMLTKAHEVNALSKILGPQLYAGLRQFLPPDTKLVLAPGMEPEARMTYWPSVQGSVRSREEVFGGLDHEGFDVAHIRHQDSTQEQLTEGTAIRSLVNEPGRVQWTFEDNVQSTAIVLSGITLAVGSKTTYSPKNPDDMGRITIGAGGAIQFPEGVEYDVIDTPGEKYRVAFVYTHLALADWVKPGAKIAAGDERALGTIEKHRRYPYSPVVPHLHFAIMLFKESEIEKYPQLNYEILNRKLGPDQTVLYVNPLSLLNQEQRARLFVEGPEAASGFGSAAIQALNKDSLKSVRARVSHALLGIPVWTAAGPGELTESMLESDAVIRQTRAGWQVRLNGRLSAELPNDQDKTLPDEDALIRHLKALDLKLRQLREIKSLSELRNYDRSELRITDEETLKKELRKNTSLLHWQLTLSAYLPEKGNDRVDIAIQIARGIRIRLSAARSLFSDPEFENAVHRYLAAWIYNLSIMYGTSFAAAGAEEDPSLVDPSKIEDLLTKGDLSSIRESLSKGTENPLGIASYANAGRPVRIKRLTELTDEEKEIQPVALQVKLQTQVPGTYLGIDIGGGSAKWAILRDGKLLDLPKELKSSTTLLTDSTSNPVFESPEDYVARLTDRARDILDYLKKTHGIEKIDGVGIDIPGAADFNNNTMVTLGQIPVKKEWNQDQVTWTGREIPRRMAEALGLAPLRVKIRNDMDGVLPGVASVLPAAKKDFWERTGGHFGFDWMGTGHGNQYAVAGVPMNAPTESGHMTFEFGQPGQPLFDTEAYTSIPSMLIYARELVRKSGKGWPEISGDQLKPLADQAFYEGNDNTQLERKAIALKVFERFAEKYAANLALRYVLAESSGFGNASEILLGGGIARGRTGALLRDLTLRQLRTYGLEQKIRITVIQDDDIRQAGLDPDDVGPAGSAYFIQSILSEPVTREEAEEFSLGGGPISSGDSALASASLKLLELMHNKSVSWIHPVNSLKNESIRNAVIHADANSFYKWRSLPDRAEVEADLHFHILPTQEEIQAFPDLEKLHTEHPGVSEAGTDFGKISGHFFRDKKGDVVFFISLIQTGTLWSKLDPATKTRYDRRRGSSEKAEGNRHSWFGALIASLEDSLLEIGVQKVAVISVEGIKEVRELSGTNIQDPITEKMYGKPGPGYSPELITLTSPGASHNLQAWVKTLSLNSEARSELRKSESSVFVKQRGTLLIDAEALASLDSSGRDELFSRLYLNKSNLRLVIFNERNQLPENPAFNAIVKLSNVFVTAEENFETAAEKYGFRAAAAVLFLKPGEVFKPKLKFLKGVLLKNQAGEIEFARLLAFNGGSLPNVPEENGVFNPPADFLSDLNQRILSALVVAYSA